MSKLIKIAITGPESTGKSQLAEELAAYYHTVFVPEYARGFIDRLDRPYNREDILEIAKGQIREEERTIQRATRMLFCDTELIVTKMEFAIPGSCRRSKKIIMIFFCYVT